MCNIWHCEVKEKWRIVISTDLLNLSALCIQLIKGKAMRCEKGHIWASNSNSGLNLGCLTRFVALSKWPPRILVFLCDTLTLPSCKVMVIMRKQCMVWKKNVWYGFRHWKKQFVKMSLLLSRSLFFPDYCYVSFEAHTLSHVPWGMLGSSINSYSQVNKI